LTAGGRKEGRKEVRKEGKDVLKTERVNSVGIDCGEERKEGKKEGSEEVRKEGTC
jgi:hypothetical protein